MLSTLFVVLGKIERNRWDSPPSYSRFTDEERRLHSREERENIKAKMVTEQKTDRRVYSIGVESPMVEIVFFVNVCVTI